VFGMLFVALENLQIVFSQEKSEEEIRSIAKMTFQNLGMMIVEFFRIHRMDAEAFKTRLEIEGLANFERVRNNKKGTLLLLSHFGNWELMGLLTKGLGSQVMVIAKPVRKNKWVDRMITEANRRGGLDNITAVAVRIETVEGPTGEYHVSSSSGDGMARGA
jgi:KDO2-lipid IV(A) lauroyltransferase